MGSPLLFSQNGCCHFHKQSQVIVFELRILGCLKLSCRYNFGWSHGKEKLESGKPGKLSSWIMFINHVNMLYLHKMENHIWLR